MMALEASYESIDVWRGCLEINTGEEHKLVLGDLFSEIRGYCQEQLV
jgi:hypothetical protein